MARRGQLIVHAADLVIEQIELLQTQGQLQPFAPSRLAQLKLSDEKLQQLAEAEGGEVLRWQEQEQLELDFNAAACLTDQTSDGSITSRIYVGIDGFMLPMVSDAERGKRFDQAKARRRSGFRIVSSTLLV